MSIQNDPHTWKFDSYVKNSGIPQREKWVCSRCGLVGHVTFHMDPVYRHVVITEALPITPGCGEYTAMNVIMSVHST
jgi:hypothetical protein